MEMVTMGEYHWYVGAAALFFSLAGTYMSLPFSQMQRDAIGCDASCYGYLMSTKAACYLSIAVIVGHMSDIHSRHYMIYIGLIGSIISFCIGLGSDSILLLAIAIIPASLNQIPAGMKALYSDYCVSLSVLDSDRITYMGYIGMAAGLSYMVGPFLGALFFASYQEALLGSIAFNLIAIVLVYSLPSPHVGVNSPVKVDNASSMSSSTADGVTTSQWQPLNVCLQALHSTLTHILAIRSPGAKLLLIIRFLMGFAYSLFNTSFNVSLKERFNFGPSDYGVYMGWVGFSYSLSQGLLIKHMVKQFGVDNRHLLLACSLCLGVGRIVAMETSYLPVVYGTMLVVNISLGVMNTVMATACADVAGTGGTIGALFGAMESIEKVSGLVGPTIGGWLHQRHYRFPAMAVCAIYTVIFASIALFYDECIIRPRVGALSVEANLPHESKLKQS